MRLGSEAGRIPVKKIETSIEIMEKINKVGSFKPQIGKKTIIETLRL